MRTIAIIAGFLFISILYTSTFVAFAVIQNEFKWWYAIIGATFSFATALVIIEKKRF